jgi:peptide methionine sulfoxide reductase msrA/msrB
MMRYLDKTPSLTPILRRIIVNKATEYPHTGVYNTVAQHGTYLCRRCGLALFRATSQFASGCGWPAFDDSIAQHVAQHPDADGMRTEILCARCQAHLGHVFSGEWLTTKNLRHCVNSASLDFVADNQLMDTEEAIIAGGCFWGVDYFMRQLQGVVKVEAGYTGGHLLNPDYQAVCQGNTGHYEAVRVVYDNEQTDYASIVQRFFEIHDPTQADGQGPDRGLQYQSALFYFNDEQKEVALKLIADLEKGGFNVVTRLLPAQPFWPAENYHQDYYGKQGKVPYCHLPVKRFSDNGSK